MGHHTIDRALKENVEDQIRRVTITIIRRVTITILPSMIEMLLRILYNPQGTYNRMQCCTPTIRPKQQLLFAGDNPNNGRTISV